MHVYIYDIPSEHLISLEASITSNNLGTKLYQGTQRSKEGGWKYPEGEILYAWLSA
jgi:hypothetical protein